MTKTTAQLGHLVRPQKDRATAAPVLFLFHGFGSNEHDLHVLASHIPQDWLVVSPRGPIEVGPNQYKWFEVERADDWFEGGGTEPKVIVDVESERRARALVLDFMDQMVCEHGGDARKVVVAGFSQGASLSLNVLLTKPEQIFAAGAFGGRVMDEIKPQIVSGDALQGTPVFLGFGKRDPFISYQQSEGAKAVLRDLGVSISTSYDSVGHSISAKHLEDFVSFLNGLTSWR